ncbi:MAG TPA: hypothetical protein VN926_05345 [Bradyrhizobium sp.]|nr:hypothetical protein [Bradyrhizobium sp.]
MIDIDGDDEDVKKTKSLFNRSCRQGAPLAVNGLAGMTHQGAKL